MEGRASFVLVGIRFVTERRRDENHDYLLALLLKMGNVKTGRISNVHGLSSSPRYVESSIADASDSVRKYSAVRQLPAEAGENLETPGFFYALRAEITVPPSACSNTISLQCLKVNTTLSVIRSVF